MAKRPQPDDPRDDPRWTWNLAPAPMELRAVHAFVKTAEGREHLSSPDALRGWLGMWNLMSSPGGLGQAELQQARAVRAALRSLIAANSGKPLGPEALARLDLAVAEAPFRLRFGAGGATYYEPLSDGFKGALARLLGAVERARTAGRGIPWRRFKICPGEACDRVFYDFSPSVTGKWCTKRCGNKLAVRDYRRRKKYRSW